MLQVLLQHFNSYNFISNQIIQEYWLNVAQSALHSGFTRVNPFVKNISIMLL